MRSLYSRVLVAMVLAVIVSGAAFLMWDMLPFREYESFRELSYCQQGVGEEKCAFDCNRTNPMLFEELQTMREHWCAAAFRSGVYERVRSSDLSGQFDDCVLTARIGIRKSEGCVVVRTRAHDSTVAAKCAEAFADEIILTQARRKESNRRQILLQLEKNKQKQVRVVEKITKGIEDAKSRSDHDKVSKLSSELAVQQKLLMGMSKEIDELNEKAEWGAEFRKIGGKGPSVAVVRPTTMQILVILVCAFLVILLVQAVLVKHSDAERSRDMFLRA